MYPRWIVLSLVCIACVAMAAYFGHRTEPQPSYNFVLNSDLQRVSWKKDVPIKMFIHSSVPHEFYPAIQLAAKKWNESMQRDLIKIEAFGGTGHDTPQKDGISMIYWLHSWDSDKPSEQARTTIYWSGNTIYEADMRINAFNFHFYGEIEEKSGCPGVDLVSLILHEMGHVFGLAHTPTIGSVMFPSLSDGTPRRHPSPLDIQSLMAEY